MKLKRRCPCLLLFALLASTALLSRARADTGVSDERLSLPDGPGSIGGVGQNASLEANMGMLGHVVPLELPEGFAGATPSLSLSYNSGAGNGVVGIGWGLEVPHIERFSLRGLPRYDASAVFAVDGSEELVCVSGPARGNCRCSA